MPRAYSRPWLAVAVAVSALLVIGAPFVGQISRWVRDVAKGDYATVLAIVVFAAAATALTFALIVIRERRRERYRWLAAAVIIAVAYASVTRSGVADVDAAERFHFVEYGLVAILFYKAWRPSADAAVVILPVLAGFIVGTVEEWLQWFVPGRVGEIRDVLLNLIAVICGVMFSLGLDPPARLAWPLPPRSRRNVSVLAAVAVIGFAVFFQSVHMGHDIVDTEAGVFRSRYTADDLRELTAERTVRWRTSPPLTVTRFSREDQYFSEGISHVRRRNERWSEGNLLAAHHENLILEKYYAPVLDAPSYVSAAGHRWPAEQRAQAATKPAGSPGFMIYDSDALPYRVFTWPRWLFWLVTLGAALAVLRAGARAA